MTVIDVGEPRTGATEELAAAATAPARWLLEMASADGVPLTQTNALARSIVREMAGRWPGGTPSCSGRRTGSGTCLCSERFTKGSSAAGSFAGARASCS